MSKKILFYTTFLTQGGGIEVVTIRYMRQFIAAGYDVDLYIDYNMGKDNIREKEIDKRIKIKYLKSERISKLIYNFRTLGKKNKLFNIFLYLLVIFSDYFVWKSEIKIVKEKKYDTTITFFQFLPGYMTKVKGPKHLIFLHGSVDKFFGGLRSLFKKQFFKKLESFDYICTVSDDMGKELIKLEPKLKNKQVTIYNPIDFKQIQKKADDYTQINEYEKKLLNESYICSVGRLDESQKDFTTLINAYSELITDKLLDEKLYLIGSGPDKDKLEKLVQTLGLQEKVLFLGRKNNPYIWMKNAKVFILSTKYEGFPTVLIEAMILNVPIVSSNCPTGPREILKNNKFGKLVKVGNKDDLKNAIKDSLREKGSVRTKEIALEFKNKVDKLF